MGTIKTWAPIVSGLVLVLRTLGWNEVADLIASSGVDAVAAVGLLIGLGMKLWSLYQKRQAKSA